MDMRLLFEWFDVERSLLELGSCAVRCSFDEAVFLKITVRGEVVLLRAIRYHLFVRHWTL